MLAVSRAVATGGPLDRALDEIAAQACAVASAHSASILELTGDERFRIVGSHNLAAGALELVAQRAAHRR